MVIYIDSDFKCHITNDGTMKSVETDFFDKKADELIEGYRFVPFGETWTREDGEVFDGEMIAPWKPWDELDTFQREYERDRYTSMSEELADAKAALAILGVSLDG